MGDTATYGRELLARKMAASRLTQERAAGMVGVSRQTIGQILAGKIRPSYELAARIKDSLGVPVAAWSEDAR